MARSTLRPHDVAIALQLVLEPGMGYEALAAAVGLSLGEAHNSVKRLERARLVRRGERIVNGRALLELIQHGVPYVFATEPGPEARGVPTAHSAPPLSQEFGAEPAVVWPSPAGPVRGQSVEPLLEGAALVASRSQTLYELLALVDAIRIGRARERKRAVEIMAQRLSRGRTSADA